MNADSALGFYKSVDHQSDINTASSHRLIQMLFNGALSRIAEAKGHLERGERAELGVSLDKIIAIVSGLQAALDREQGGELAENLYGLYDYMSRTLLKVHIVKNTEPLDEVAALLGEIKLGWDAIAPEA